MEDDCSRKSQDIKLLEESQILDPFFHLKPLDIQQRRFILFAISLRTQFCTLRTVELPAKYVRIVSSSLGYRICRTATLHFRGEGKSRRESRRSYFAMSLFPPCTESL